VELLGPLRLLVAGVPVEVVGPKRRAALALLAFAEDRVVPTDHLVHALWPPDGADPGRAALHNHVSRLRRHLGPAATRLRTSPSGYQLELGREGLDVAQARALLAESGRAPDATRSYELLRQAYGLWRGPVLADLVEYLPIASAVRSCEGLRRDITDALVDAAIAAGSAVSIVDVAEMSYLDDPLREPAALLLMRALASAGRTAEALRIGAEFRQRLADETGLDPSSALGELVGDIARGQASKDALLRVSPQQGVLPSRTGGVPQADGRAHHSGAHRSDAVAAPVLPSNADRLIGRDSTVASLHRLLATERLVTLVGPGGVGKTRVAREVGRRSEPVTVLLLASVVDPAAIPHALTAALGLTVVQGDPLSACLTVLADRAGVLLIDNCEHLLEAVRSLVETLLARCPQLTVLTTSREPLGLPTEYVSRLAPLPLPGGEQDVTRAPAVALFLERAARVRPDAALAEDRLPAVADVVRRLDGMPLAIELAAGRLSTFSI
jgi:DNA-binding SARP family transcriptional activator